VSEGGSIETFRQAYAPALTFDGMPLRIHMTPMCLCSHAKAGAAPFSEGDNAVNFWFQSHTALA
jgi:hypothetical protein